MKKGFVRLLTALLATSMLLSSCAKNKEQQETSQALVPTDTTANTDSPVPNVPEANKYYAKYGSNGDGKTIASPAGSIAGVIQTINNDGHTTGAQVVVYVLKADNEPTDNKWDSSDDNVFLSYPTDGECSHKATITYTSLDSVNIGAIAFENMWAPDTYKSEYMAIVGPTVFNNLRIIDNSNANESQNIFAQGYDFSIQNCTMLKISKDAGYELTSWGGTVFAGASGSGRGSQGLGGELSVSDTSNVQSISASGYSASPFQKALTVEDNVTVRLEEDNFAKLYLDGSKINIKTTFKKNVNVVLNGTNISEFVTNNIPNIEGALQVIMNNGAKITNDAVSTILPAEKQYFVTAENGGTLDVTDTVGTFKVLGGGCAYAISEDGRTVYYGDKQLTLPAGKHTVKFAADVNAVIAALPVPSPFEGDAFVKWQDNCDGTIIALFGNHVNDYYVKDGENGDGRYPMTPAGTVAEVIAAINEDGFGEGDNVVVYIMERENVTELDIGKLQEEDNSFTAWVYDLNATLPKHSATLVVTSYDYQNTPDSMTHLSFSTKVADNACLVLSGPAIFKDIKLLWPREATDRAICANGYALTLQNVKFMRTDAERGTNKKPYSQVKNANKVYLYVAATSSGGATTVNLNTPIKLLGTDATRCVISISGYTYKSTVPPSAMDAHSAIYFNNPEIYATIKYGENKNYTFKNGLSFVANDFAILSASSDDSYMVTVSGGLQIVNNSGKEFPSVEKNVEYDALWKIDTNNCKLDITDTVGTYKVPDGIVAVATNTVTGISVVSKNGILTLEAGAYTVEGIAVSNLAQYTASISFDGRQAEDIYVKDTVVYLPMLANQVSKNFVGWNDGTKTYNAGETYTVQDAAVEFTSVWDAVENLDIVYVSESGNDEHDGSEGKPVRTLSKAVAMLNAMSGENKKVVILGAYSYEGTLPTSSNRIIYCGDGTGDNRLVVGNTDILLGGPTTFENIALASSTSGKFFISNGHSLTIGNSVSGIDGNVIPLVITTSSVSAQSIYIQIDSGKFNTLTVGGDMTATQKLYITVNGGEIAQIKFTSFDESGAKFTSDVSLAINGGSVGLISVEDATFSAAFCVILNNGIGTSMPKNITAGGGVWIVKTDKQLGCYLAFTDILGKYTVIGDKTAVATAKDGAQIGGVSELVLVAGEYDVEFIYGVKYIYSNDKITVLTDCTINLSTITPDNKNGYVFIGWKVNDSAPETVDTYAKGDVLVAQYVEYNKQEDFKIVGTDVATGTTNDLHFIINKKNDFASTLPSIVENGTIWLPTNDTMGRDMFIDSEIVIEWKWDPKNPNEFSVKTTNGITPNKVTAQMVEGEQYRLCITDIQQEDYYTYYSAKAYIIFTDINGIQRVVYSDYYQTNLYKATKDKIAADGTTAALASIKEYVEVTRKEVYMALNMGANGELIKKLSGYSDTADTNPNHLMYELANGMRVREVTVDSGTGGDAVEIIQFADVHLNYINEEDIDIADPRTLSTYRGRTWNRDGASVGNINTVMEYASFFDKVIVTGDIWDYFSWGCAEVTNKLIFDKDDTILAAVGNHEPAEVMQPDSDIIKNQEDTYTLEERYERIQKNWPNDLKYHSEIMYNDAGTAKVMLVILDNQRAKYWAEQEPLLAADITKARQMNIPILIFQHDPICTKNPEPVQWFYETNNATSSRDWSNEYAGKNGSDAATMAVYNLIVRNSDVIKGVFCGHDHENVYTEIYAQNADGTFKKDNDGKQVVIPQHVVTANGYDNGNVIKITVK